MNQLLDGLNLDNNKMGAYVGRSKFTKYGKCLVTFGDVEEIIAETFPQKIFLRLETPLIPLEDNFIEAKKILATEILGELGEKFSIGKVFAARVEIENFVMTWGLKSPRVSALEAGTIFELKIAEPLTDDEQKFLSKKIYDGFENFDGASFGAGKILCICRREKSLPATRIRKHEAFFFALE